MYFAEKTEGKCRSRSRHLPGGQKFYIFSSLEKFFRDQLETGVMG